MKFDTPDGFVVIPLGEDGAPRMGALWCATAKEAEEVYRQELADRGAHYPMPMFRSSEKPASKPSPKPKPKPAIRAGARHRIED